MSTIRLYHEDQYLDRFDSRVVESESEGGRAYLILERTAFYPTSGGQPHDTGTIEGLRVVEVREETPWGRIRHIVRGSGGALPGPGERVRGEIDRGRRFDHMQQHTGQHLLSRGFVVAQGAHTVSFHLGDADVTVDLDTPSLSQGQVDDVEDLLAGVIREDRPVIARWVSPSEVPEGVEVPEEGRRTGRVRLLEISGFDIDPCCGTHCSRTGEVGAISILGWERVGRHTRVAFLCGERARRDARARMRWSRALARNLSTEEANIPQLMGRAIDEAKGLRRRHAELIERIASHEASAIRPERHGEIDVVCLDLQDRPTEEALALSRALQSHPRTLVLLSWKDGSGARVLAARSEDLAMDVRGAVRAAAGILGGRSGGHPHTAQGGGPDSERLTEAVEEMARQLGVSG